MDTRLSDRSLTAAAPICGYLGGGAPSGDAESDAAGCPRHNHLDAALDGSGGVVTDEIFRDHDVAEPGDREIRLRRDDEAKALQIGAG